MNSTTPFAQDQSNVEMQSLDVVTLRNLDDIELLFVGGGDVVQMGG